MFGLEREIVDLVIKYFHSKPQILKVYIFGSRALGRENKGSDIDLAIITTEDFDLSGKIKLELEELPTPYLFDVVDLKFIENSNLKDHIQRAGKLLFER